MSPSLTAGFSDTLVGSDCYPSHIFNNYLGYLTEQAITLLSHMTCKCTRFYYIPAAKKTDGKHVNHHTVVCFPLFYFHLKTKPILCFL